MFEKIVHRFIVGISLCYTAICITNWSGFINVYISVFFGTTSLLDCSIMLNDWPVSVLVSRPDYKAKGRRFILKYFLLCLGVNIFKIHIFFFILFIQISFYFSFEIKINNKAALYDCWHPVTINIVISETSRTLILNKM